MVGPPWIAVLGSGPRVDADNRSPTNPLTGKPDAGDPPVRFGGRGSGKPFSLPLSRLERSASRVQELRPIGARKQTAQKGRCGAQPKSEAQTMAHGARDLFHH